MSGKRKREVSGTLSVFTNYISEENSITSQRSNGFEGTYVYCSQYAVVAVSVFVEGGTGNFIVQGSFDGDPAIGYDILPATFISANTLFFKRIALKYPYIRVIWGATGSTDPPTTIYTVLEKQGLTPDDVELPIVGSSEINAGTGIAVTEAPPGVFEITNTAPDQTVTITAGAGISAVGPYPDFTVTNTAPDLPVQINSADASVTVTGGYPIFDLEVTGGTATDVTLSSAGTGATLVSDSAGPLISTKALNAGTGISITGTATDDLVLTNTAPDLPVQINSADASVTVTGGYPIFDLEVNGGTATDVTLSSAGTGATLVSDSAGPLISTKALNAGTGISITGTATDDLVLTNTDPGSAINLIAGTDVAITGTYPDITISSTGGGGGGGTLQYANFMDTSTADTSFNFNISNTYAPIRADNGLTTGIYYIYGNTSDFTITKDVTTNVLRFTYIGSTTRTFFFRVRAGVKQGSFSSATLGLARNGLYTSGDIINDLGQAKITVGTNNTIWEISHTTINILNQNDYINAVMSFGTFHTDTLSTFNMSIHSID